MKKTLTYSLFVLTILTFVTLSTIAQTTEKESGYISVNKSTTKEVPPNQAEISIEIETSDKSMQKASNDNKKIATEVIQSTKKLLGKDDTIKTSNYTARPQYSYTKDNKQVLDKYIVSNAVAVKTNNLSLVSKIIDTAIAQGATKINNLDFSTTDSDSVCTETLSELTKKAYYQANIIAKSINSSVIGIRSINTSCSADNGPRPMYGMMMMKSAMDAASSTPIESGKIRVYANIDASFYVK